MRLGDEVRQPTPSSRRSIALTWRWASAACREAGSFEIYGPESSGKTTVALHAVATAAAAVAAFIGRGSTPLIPLRPEAGGGHRPAAGEPARYSPSSALEFADMLDPLRRVTSWDRLGG